MERIRNIYCWDYMRDWHDAQNAGILHVVEARHNGEGMFGWEQLIHMMHENCFPQCFLCVRKNRENYLILTKEQKNIVDFIDDKIAMQKRDGAQSLFSDLPAKDRSRILSARVDSIWLKLDENENLTLAFPL